jgi:hypothetical protein
MLSLEELIKSDLFAKVETLQAVISNGIMDFLVELREAQDSSQKPQFKQIFGDQLLPSTHQKEELPIEFTGSLIENSATLDSDKIKPADRVTFLLNYLYAVLRNNHFNWASCSEQISILRETFIAVLTPYV